MDRAARTVNAIVRTTLALIALVAGTLAAIARSPEPSPATDEIGAVELAEWIRDRRPRLTVLDTRSAEAMERDRLPGARAVADFDFGALRAGDTLVVYADQGMDAAAVEALLPRLGSVRVLRLHGGIAGWNDEVLFPVVRADASRRQQREFIPRAQLSRYFGGTPRVLEPGAAPNASRSRRGC
jgi:rhodanese-related sulfurtransferase